MNINIRDNTGKFEYEKIPKQIKAVPISSVFVLHSSSFILVMWWGE